jgi:VCBS repeat-containing protein
MLDVSADQGTFSRCIRLVIADRQPIVLQGLKSVFAAQRDFEIVASCSTGTSCLETIRNLAPDVALLANTLPDLAGSDILAIARAENLSTRLVFFTESESDDDLAAAIAAGACSAISKYANPDTMLRSLRLMTERIGASPERSQHLSANGKKVDGAKIENMLGMLTHRERQIARLVCDGLSNKEIARQLNVSRGTVKVHLHNIFQKLEISNRTVLATIASLQRSAGFGTLALALAFGILSDAKASNTNDTDDDSTAHEDPEQSVVELWKTAILRHIIVADPGDTVVLPQRGSPIKVSQVAHSATKMEEVHAAEQAVLSNFGRGYGPIGSGTPYLFMSPLLQAIDKGKIGGPMAPQQLPPLEFASNLTKGHGGFGTFIMTAAGVWAYTLDTSNAAMKAPDPGETLIDTSKVATMDGTTQVATITIEEASDVNANEVDDLAPELEGNAGQVCGGARVDTLNATSVVDVIYGGSGNDKIEGNGGDDTIHGGTGGDTVNGNDGNDAIIGGYGGDQLTGSNGDDIFVHLSAIASNSTQFDTIIDFTSGTDKINLAALGALAFLHLTSTAASVPPHTLAWIYNPTSNETIIYVNPTDRALDIGDPGLLEIHLQGVVSVAESDFVHEPEAAAVAASLEVIDPALLLAAASDETTDSALASIEAEASESTPGTAGVWTMPADDGLRFHFARDRISSTVSIKRTSFSDDSASATVESNDYTLSAPVHVLSIELGEVPGNSGGDGNAQQAPHSAPAKASAPPELTEPGVTPGHTNSPNPSHSASASVTAAAEPVVTTDAPGNSAGHGNAQHASKASAANEPSEPGATPGHGHSHPSHSASARAAAAAEPVETTDAPGNSAGHGNAQHGSNSAAANASEANEPKEPGATPGHGHSHPSHHGNAQQASNSAAANASAANEPTEPAVTPGHGHSPPTDAASASAVGAAEPFETGDPPGNDAGHGNAQQASNSASATASAAGELTEPGVTPGHSNSQNPSHSPPASAVGAAEPVETGNAPGSAGHSNSQASHSAAPNASAPTQPVEFASWTGGAGQEPAFHFKDQGAPSTPVEAVEPEQLSDRPVLPGHADGLAAIDQSGPAAMEEHAASHVSNGQHHATGHLPHELLI